MKLDERGLSKEMEASRGCLSRTCGQSLEANENPPTHLTPEVWAEAQTKLKPHGDTAMPAVDATTQQTTDARGWTKETAKAAFLRPL